MFQLSKLMDRTKNQIREISIIVMDKGGSQIQLSRREKEMIECFIKHGLTLTAQELAGFANVSTKTIYRAIRKINEASKHGDIILAEVGKGFRLDYAN